MSLYNEERPGTFLEVLGQEIAVRQMKRKLKEGRFPQTALLTGPRGTGKTTCARIIAKALNCESPGEDGEPCCACLSCRAVAAGTSPAVIEMDAATRSGVDDVRSLIAESAYVPAGKKKVFILDEVHMFSTAAWNALLKTLEEPPKDVVFLLATTELQKVPATVLSRCVRFEFKTIPPAVIEGRLDEICRQRGTAATAGALSLIAGAAEGCVRDALSLLEQFLGFEEITEETVRECLGLSPNGAAYDLLEAIASGDAKAAVGIVSACEDRGRSLLLLTRSVIEATADALCAKATGKADGDRAKALAASLGEARLSEVAGAFLSAYQVLSKNERLSFFLRAKVVSLVSSESLLTRIEREVEALKAGRAAVPAAGCEEGAETEAAYPAAEERPLREEVRKSRPEATDGTAGGEGASKVIAFERPFDGEGFPGEEVTVPGFNDYGGIAWEDLEDSPARRPDGEGSAEEGSGGLVRGLTADDLSGLLEDDGEEKGTNADGGSEGNGRPAYEAQSEDDPNAAFDFFMSGGSARRK